VFSVSRHVAFIVAVLSTYKVPYSIVSSIIYLFLVGPVGLLVSVNHDGPGLLLAALAACQLYTTHSRTLVRTFFLFLVRAFF
jgi:hypothetical protein